MAGTGHDEAADLQQQLLEAAKKGDIDTIRRLFDTPAASLDPNKGTWDERTIVCVAPLHAAAAKGNMDVARFLIEKGADVSLVAEGLMECFLPITIAAKHGHADLVRLFLDSGAKVDDTAKGGLTALMRACEHGQAGVAQLLLASGADVKKQDSRGVTALLYAAAGTKSAECVRLLLEAGADANDSGRILATEVTALMAAARSGGEEAVRLLLEHGANPKATDGYGASAMNHAGHGGSVAVIRLLHERGADPNHVSRNGTRAIEEASEAGHLDAVRALHALGCDIGPQPPPPPEEGEPEVPRRRFPLVFAMRCKDGEKRRAVATWLLENGADVHACEPVSGNTALHLACSTPGEPTATEADEADLRIVRALLERGARMDEPAKIRRAGEHEDPRMLVPFEAAATYGRLDMMRAIVEKGFVVSKEVASEALCDAAGRGYAGVVRELLALGADPNYHAKKARWRAMPLLQAMGNGDPQVVQLLLDAGADIHARDPNQGTTPLLMALEPYDHRDGRTEKVSRKLPLLKMLVGLGADVNAVTDDGETCLGVAAELATAEAGLLLLSLGAKARVKSRLRGTPAMRAARSGNAVLLRAILEAEKKEAPPQGEDVDDPLTIGLNSPLEEALEANSSETIQVLIEHEEQQVEQPGRIWPTVVRGEKRDDHRVGKPKQDQLIGVCSGYLALARHGMSKGNLDHVRKGLDWLLMCPGDLRAEDFAELEQKASEGGPAGARDPFAAAAHIAEARRPARVPEGAAASDPIATEPTEGATALMLACRHGLRLTAARLAAASANVDERNAAGETALFHAVSFGRPMLDVCLLLIRKGADLMLRVGPSTVLDATGDVLLRADLKRAAKVREVFISYGHHPPEVAEFTKRLRDALEERGISCWLDEMKLSGIEAGAEWREQIGEGIKAAQAVVFVASGHSCRSDWCMRELARARDIGRPIFPVWREKIALQDSVKEYLLRSTFVDFSSDDLFRAGLPAFAEALQAAIAAGAGPPPDAAEAAAALLALPEARCDVGGGGGGHVVLWCCPEDAGFARLALLGLRDRRLPVWLDCKDSEEGWERAVASCAVFIPVLSRAALAGPTARAALRSRVEAALRHKRPIRPALLEPFKVPAALEYSLSRLSSAAFLADDPDGFFPALDRLVAALPSGAAAAQPPAAPGRHGTAPEGGGAKGAASTKVAAAREELAKVTAGLAALESAVAALEARLAGPRGDAAERPAAPAAAKAHTDAARQPQARSGARPASQACAVC